MSRPAAPARQSGKTPVKAGRKPDRNRPENRRFRQGARRAKGQASAMVRSRDAKEGALMQGLDLHP
jgi:hypothetical protein